VLGTDLGTVTKVETMVSGNDGVVIVREDLCRDVVSDADAFTAVEAVFAAMAAGDAVNCPVVREAIGHADTLYGIKSGFDRAGMALGVKSGGYLPQNVTNVGISNHQSSVSLFDPDTGRLQAVIGGRCHHHHNIIQSASVDGGSCQPRNPCRRDGYRHDW